MTKETIKLIDNLVEDNVLFIEKTDDSITRLLALNMLWSGLLFLVAMLV